MHGPSFLLSPGFESLSGHMEVHRPFQAKSHQKPSIYLAAVAYQSLCSAQKHFVPAGMESYSHDIRTAENVLVQTVIFRYKMLETCTAVL